MRLTHEQENAVNAFASGINLRIKAYAGAGKTSTLRSMADVMRSGQSGLYLAFNRAIAAESMTKFARTPVNVRTTHSLAFRWATDQGYTSEKLTRSLDMRAIAGLPVASEFRGAETTGRRLALATLRKWMQSDAPFISSEFIPDHVFTVLRRMTDEPCELTGGIVQTAINIWNEALRLDSQVPLGHDGYLKAWARTNPQLQADVVFVDEAQDLNPVVIGVLRTQSRQLVSVGDNFQAIYSWRGAIDALQILPGTEMHLTQSFRFGGEIAEVANGLLQAMANGTPPLIGNGKPGFVGIPDGEPDAILCRTNAGVFGAIAEQPGCGIAGGANELRALIMDIERLQHGQSATGPDLFSFGDWAEVVDAVAADEGSSLTPIVRIVEKHGVVFLKRALATVAEHGQPVIGTAHKTKGLEFPHVLLQDDFAAESPSLEERRLFYVALTRAKFEVNVNPEVLGAYMTEMEEYENM
jgi:superfamily I DNA/RNA helicase